MPANLFNFSRYFKKPSDDSTTSSSLDSESTSDTSTMNQQAVGSSQKIAKSAIYNGIGNPSQGVSYNGIGTQSGVQPLAVNNLAVATSSIDMGKRVGMDVLSRLTQRANKALMLAVDKTKELHQEFIDTEHILWGLLHDNSIYQLISDCKLTPSDIQKEIEASFKPGNFVGQPHFSPRVKRVLEISLSTARSSGFEFISPEHILLALASEGEGLAARILVKYNLKTAVLNQKVTGKKELEKEQESKKNSSLDQFTEDLTAKAAKGELDPVVGRSWEIERVIHILSRRTKNNPVLIGDAGVGKTAIVEGLAERIARQDVPETLMHKKILLLDLMSLIAGAKHRGEFEERLKNLIKEVKIAAGNIILFIDEIHNMVGAGSGNEGTMDASNILKPSLARGELQVIGTTTITEYRKNIEKDPALERRFQPVLVSEPTQEVAIEMVTALRDKYEAFHRVKISDEAIEAAVRLSARYISDRFLPDKAVDLIDEAAAAIRLPSISLPEEIKSGEEKLKRLENEKKEAEKNQDQVRLETITKEIEKIKINLTNLKEQYQLKKSTTTNAVSPETIAEIVSRWTNIPISKLTEKESGKLLNLENIIHERLINQNEAVEAVSEAVRRGRAGLKSSKRPIGSFIFLGPTGVGKTELAKTLAEVLFGSEEMIVRLDMTEYMEKHEVAKLIGAPPGYVGYEEGGQLTEAVRRRPYSVVLLDEIEKAHPDVFNILIQLLDDGRLTDNKGRTISFKNTIVICTSNLGSGIIQEEILKKEDADKPIQRTRKLPRFSTYAISPTGRQILTTKENYWENDGTEKNWKTSPLADYFAGCQISADQITPMDFPINGFDTHLIAPDGSETITKDGDIWFRTSTIQKEWSKNTLLSWMKNYLVINATPDRSDQQLPSVKIDTHAVLPTGGEMITLGDRFWKRESLQTKEWTTGLLKEYFQTQKSDDKKENFFPMEKWDVHLFTPNGDELIVYQDFFWKKTASLGNDWKKGLVKDYFGENISASQPLPLGGESTEKDANQDENFIRIAEKLSEELRKFFRPELLNRFDEIIIFRPLSRDNMDKIVDLQAKTLEKLLIEQNIKLIVKPPAKSYLCQVGFDPVFGARPLRRTIQRLVENQISSLLIKGEAATGDTVFVDFDGSELQFQVEKGRQTKKEAVSSEVSVGNTSGQTAVKKDTSLPPPIKTDKTETNPSSSLEDEAKPVANPKTVTYCCNTCGFQWQAKRSVQNNCPMCQGINLRELEVVSAVSDVSLDASQNNLSSYFSDDSNLQSAPQASQDTETTESVASSATT